MSEVRQVPRAARASAALRYVSLAAGLAGVLSFAYGQILPLPREWLPWPPRLLLACLAGLALARGLSPGGVGGGQARASLAFAAGLASATLGFGAIVLIGFGLGLRVTEEHLGARTFLYQMTHVGVVLYLLAIAGFVAAPGALGLWLARREGPPESRASLASAAARFSLCGLGSAGLIAAALAVALGLRWAIWG